MPNGHDQDYEVSGTGICLLYIYTVYILPALQQYKNTNKCTVQAQKKRQPEEFTSLSKNQVKFPSPHVSLINRLHELQPW